MIYDKLYRSTILLTKAFGELIVGTSLVYPVGFLYQSDMKNFLTILVTLSFFFFIAKGFRDDKDRLPTMDHGLTFPPSEHL